MGECYDPRNAQSHLSSKATAFSIASLMASDENGISYTLLLSYLFSSRIIRCKLLLERQVLEVTVLMNLDPISIIGNSFFL